MDMMHAHPQAPDWTPHSGEPAAPHFNDLPGTDGLRYSLDSFKDARILVVVFVGNGCPSTRALEPWLLRFQDSYRPKGVQLILVNSNNASLSPPDTFQEMIKRAEKRRYGFPYLKDDDRSVAAGFDATHTPEAFVLDEARHVRYRGRLADSRRAATITLPYVKNAVDDLLAGREVAVPETEPYGCAIVV